MYCCWVLHVVTFCAEFCYILHMVSCCVHLSLLSSNKQMITPIQSSNIGNHKGHLLTKCDVIADIEHCSHLSTINTLMTNQRKTLSLRYIHDKCHFTNEFVIDCQSGRYCTTYNKDYRSASNSNSILRYVIYHFIMISFSMLLGFFSLKFWYMIFNTDQFKEQICPLYL